jgi:hypothetical protein
LDGNLHQLKSLHRQLEHSEQQVNCYQNMISMLLRNLYAVWQCTDTKHLNIIQQTCYCCSHFRSLHSCHVRILTKARKVMLKRG